MLKRPVKEKETLPFVGVKVQLPPQILKIY